MIYLDPMQRYCGRLPQTTITIVHMVVHDIDSWINLGVSRIQFADIENKGGFDQSEMWNTS